MSDPIQFLQQLLSRNSIDEYNKKRDAENIDPAMLPWGGKTDEQVAQDLSNSENRSPASAEPSLFNRVSNKIQEKVAKGDVGAPSGPSAPVQVKAPVVASPLEQAPVQVNNPGAYGQGLEDSDLQSAQDQANRNRMIGMLANASSRIGSALSKGAVGAEKIGQGIIDNADNGVKQIVQRREGKDKELSRKKLMDDMKDEDALRNPNSEITKALRDGANLFGITVGPNTTGKQLRDSGINLGSLLAAKEAANARRDAAEATRMAKEEKTAEKKEKDAQLSDKQVSSITSFDQAIGTLDSIMDEKKQWDTGKASFGTNAVAGWIGLDDSKKSAFKSNVGENLALYIKNISGATVSPSERIALLANVPSVYDNDATFMEKAKSVKERIMRNKRIELDSMEKGQKKDVSAFRDKEVSTDNSANDPRVDAFMQKNGIKDRNKAIKILKEAGKI